MLRDTWHLTQTVARGGYLTLLAVETGLAVGLLFPSLRPLFLRCAFAFLLFITISPVVQLDTGSLFGCGCGVPHGVMSPTMEQATAVARNLTVLAVTWPIIFRRR